MEAWGFYSLNGFQDSITVESFEVPREKGKVVSVSEIETAKELQKILFNYVYTSQKGNQEIVESIINQGINVITISNNGTDGSPKEVIEKEKLFNVFIFGMPRSGTSMITHILELLGVNMVYDSEDKVKKEIRDEQIKEKFGKDYHPNKTGFFEITSNFLGHYLKIWSVPYSGCKMLIPITDFQYEIVRRYPSKVILTTRNPEEISISQITAREKFFDIKSLEMLLEETKVKLELYNIPFLTIDFKDMISHPKDEINRIKDFIKSENNISEAVNFVNPNLSNFTKKEKENV